MQTYRTIRRNARSVQLNIPIEFVRAFGLNAGDSTLWSAEGDTVTLKFFRVTSDVAPASMEQGQVVEAT
jgi:hypothetical protein